MNKIDEALIKAQCKTAAKMEDMPDNLKKRAKYARMGFITITSMMMLLLMTTCVLADTGGEISTKIATGMKDVYKVISGITIPIAIIAFSFCAFQIFAGGEKGMEKAKKCALYTIIALAIVFLAPVIITQASKWFAGNTETTGAWDGSIPTV